VRALVGYDLLGRAAEAIIRPVRRRAHRPALVHRPVTGRGLGQREIEVEDPAGVIPRVQMRSTRPAREVLACSPPESWGRNGPVR
jgi:hypothetical protein